MGSIIEERDASNLLASAPPRHNNPRNTLKLAFCQASHPYNHLLLKNLRALLRGMLIALGHWAVSPR
jgi:hypothetical protein